MTQIKTIKISGEIYFSTLSMYRAIGLFAHQKLKDRIGRIGLEMHQIDKFGTALTLADSVRILKAYQENSEGERLTRVNELLQECKQMTASQEETMGKSEISKAEKLTQENKLTHRVNQKPQNAGKLKTTRLTHKKRQTVKPKKTKTFLYYLTELTVLLRTEQFIFLILFFAIGIQINHTAHLYHRAGASLEPSAGWIGAYIFGTVTELTALLLTIHDGKKNKLLIFAFLTFWVNMLYYEVWKSIATISPEVMYFINKMTLSGIIAFVLYAYTDLFTGWVREK